MPAVDPIVLKASADIILFSFIFIPLLHVLRKKAPLEIVMIPSALISFFIIFATVYGMNVPAYSEEASQVAKTLAGDYIIYVVIPFAIFLVAGLATAYILARRLSKQTYRSLFHMVIGSFFVLVMLISINLVFITISIAIMLFCTAEYLRKCEDKGPVAIFVRGILTPVLRDGEFEGYMASLFFLISTLVVALFLYPATIRDAAGVERAVGIKYAVCCIAVLTFSDPSATLVGRKFGRHKWKRNPQKSLEGSAAMFTVATITIMILDFGMGYEIGHIGLATALVVAFCVTLSESLPLKIGDNLIIPLLAGMVMLSGVSSLLIKLDPYFLFYIVPLFVSLGALAYFTGMLDTLGTEAAVFFGILVFISAGYRPALLISLLMFLVLGFMFTKFGYEYKKNLGAAEPGEGRRGVNPVVANGIIPTFTAVLYPFNPTVSITLFIGAVSAALADTAATELGVFHKNPMMITTGERVKPGTRGAVSLLGEVAAIFGALAMGGVVITLLSMSSFAPVPAPLINPINLVFTAMVCGIVGCNIDSFLGASMRSLSKEEVNMLGTLSGTGIALIMTLLGV
jgi:uncharacterized protein (TIGR00297 family)